MPQGSKVASHSSPKGTLPYAANPLYHKDVPMDSNRAVTGRRSTEPPGKSGPMGPGAQAIGFLGPTGGHAGERLQRHTCTNLAPKVMFPMFVMFYEVLLNKSYVETYVKVMWSHGPKKRPTQT